MKTLFAAVIAGAFVGMATDVRAGVVNVFVGDTSWTSSGNSGSGSSSITATTLLDGDGAVAINGDRTRFNITNKPYGTLSSLSAFNFQWAVTQIGPTVPTGQASALRLFVFDPAANRNIQFVWEDGEQSSPVFVGGAGSLNTTYTGDFFGAANRVFAFTSGVGLGRGLYNGANQLINGSDSAQSIGSLINTLNSSNAFVFSYGLGVGSSVGAFQGFADRVTIGFGTGDSTTYNFRTAANQVPEPASLTLLGLGLIAAFGATAWGRKRA